MRCAPVPLCAKDLSDTPQSARAIEPVQLDVTRAEGEYGVG